MASYVVVASSITVYLLQPNLKFAKLFCTFLVRVLDTMHSMLYGGTWHLNDYRNVNVVGCARCTVTIFIESFIVLVDHEIEGKV